MRIILRLLNIFLDCMYNTNGLQYIDHASAKHNDWTSSSGFRKLRLELLNSFQKVLIRIRSSEFIPQDKFSADKPKNDIMNITTMNK